MKLNEQNLLKWLEEVYEAGMNDEDFEIAIFPDTRYEEYAICAGWTDGFDANDPFTLTSKKNPTWGLCVKIVINEINEISDWYAGLNMPWLEDGEVLDVEHSFTRDPEDLKFQLDTLIDDYDYISETYKDVNWKLR